MTTLLLPQRVQICLNVCYVLILTDWNKYILEKNKKDALMDVLMGL